MVLIDTHTHLYLPHFEDDIEEVIQKAGKHGVAKMLLPNIDMETAGPMLKLCNRFPEHCHPMLGLHPTSVSDDFRTQLSKLESLSESSQFVAIGETGMDAYWDTKYISQQEESFVIHIEWAKKMDLPVVIHSRETMDRVLDILTSHASGKPTGVLHAFSGSVKQAELATEMGFKLGIGGVVTYKNSGLTPVIEAVALENILLETDSPYLTPVPNRGKRNESSNLVYIAGKIAEIKGLPIEEVAHVTTRNAAELFRLKVQPDD